jgi:hypothetical protein
VSAAAVGRPDRRRRTYLGYRGDDHDTPWASFFEPRMAPLPRHVEVALAHGALAPPVLLRLEDAPALLDDGDLPTEDGYGVLPDGSIHVAVRTEMPGVTPAMWDWWFGWHGSDSRRYKLWHPRAHLFAQWADGDDAGRRGRERYAGRTSFVDEYLGSTKVHGAISFVTPGSLGLDEAALADPERATAVCARVGSSDLPVEVGHLIHHVRATPVGAEMRSRFWMGGRHLALRERPGPWDRAMRPVAARVLGASARSAQELLVHCAQEMNHLAARLPALHERFGGD